MRKVLSYGFIGAAIFISSVSAGSQDRQRMGASIPEDMQLFYEQLNQYVDPPCDIRFLDYYDTCGILGPNSNNISFWIDGPSGYYYFHKYFFYARPGDIWVTLSDIDEDAAYCALVVYERNDNTIPVIWPVEGGGPSLQLHGQIPELGWYFIIATTYGCGPWDDDSIRINISHQPPEYDLSVTTELPWTEFYDAHPDTGVWVYFVLEDIGADPYPYFHVGSSGFFPASCDCDYDYVYPISFATYAGPGITCDSLDGLEFSSYIDTFYMGGDQLVLTVGPERITASYGDASELWDVYVNVDPNNLIPETDEQNNCSLVAHIGWYHHINGIINGLEWQPYGTAPVPINGLEITLRKGMDWSTTTTSHYEPGKGDGYFDFWEPYLELDRFQLYAELEIPSIIKAVDSVYSSPVNMETAAYTDISEFSKLIIWQPVAYTTSTHWDSLFNAGANSYFGIENVNDFMSQQLGNPYNLPYLDFIITTNTDRYTMEGGIPRIFIGYDIDDALYYDRAVMGELAHVVHNYAIAPGLYVLPGCSMHFPGGGSEGEQCAFTEGWAGFFTAVVPYANPYTFTSPRCGRYDITCLNENNIETNDWLNDYILGEGQYDEGAVETFLYDLWDYYTPYGLDDGDGLAEPFGRIYGALQGIDTFFSILNFANQYIYYELYYNGDPNWEQKRDSICIMLWENKIDASGDVQNCQGAGFVCGDANHDGLVTVADATYLIDYIFKEGPAPEPMEAGDANCDGAVNQGDPVWIISYIFRGGPPPCCP